MEPTRTIQTLVLYVVISVIIGFIAGFFVQRSKTTALQRELDRFQMREQAIKKAGEDVAQSVKESQVTPSQVKKAEEDIIKSLAPR